MTHLRQKAAQGIKAGDVLEVSRTFTKECIDQFADISLDYNPVHFDERWTKLKGFSGPVCHGLLVGGMLTEIGGQIGMLASGMNFRFKKPVYPGDTITCRITFDEVDERYRAKCTVDFTNQDQEQVLEAQLFGIVPDPDAQDVLKQMMVEGDPSNRLSLK
jgi:acyl dehydratase